MDFKTLTIEEYANEVAKKSSVPGGGSVLALTDELAASLLLMVCNFTKEKKGYEDHFRRIEFLMEKVNMIKKRCHDLIDEDARAFKDLMDAFSSKDTMRISNASINAALIPHELLKCSQLLIDYAEEIILIGNKNLISDAEIALDLIKSTINGSLHHIEINLSGIKNESIKNKLLRVVEERKYNGEI